MSRAVTNCPASGRPVGLTKCDPVSPIRAASVSRAVCDENWREVARISELAAAMQPTLERRLESLNQGAAFLTAVAAGWPHPLIDRFREHCHGDLALPVAVGASTAAHGLPLEAVLVASVHAFAAMLVSAGVRLIPLGQTDGLRVISRLEPLIPLLMVPAADHGWANVALISGIFGVVTIATMLGVVFAGLSGLSFVSLKSAERFAHALAGAVVAMCGGATVFLGA